MNLVQKIGQTISVTSGTNQISGYCYDLAGNILDYTSCPDGGHNFVYDAEHRLLSSGNGATTYAYDGNGERFAQTDSSGQRQYVYDLNGDMLMSTGISSGQTNVNAYADHRLIATVDHGSGNLTYPYTDWLGTKRVEENGAGTATTNTCASLPFGDALNCSGTDAEV